MLSRLYSLVLFAALFGLMLPLALAAEDKEPAAETEAEDDRPLKEQWDEAFAERTKLFESLNALKEEFQEAKDDRKEEIQQEFQRGQQQLFAVVLPKLNKIAAQVFADDPKNFDAGEVAVLQAFQKNQYAEADKLAGQALKVAGKKHDTMLVSNIQAVAKFALHDFAGANEIFSKLEDQGKLHPDLGERYREASEQYADFWEEEQAIRKKEAAAKGDAQLPRVLLETDRGDIELELFENEAPNTVANFISLVEAKKYDGIKFHRVIPNFMAQSGDPNSMDDDPNNDGQGGPGYTIKCECYAKNARKHFRGSLSMAKTREKDTGGSQFFLTHMPTPHLNANPQLESGHTVFGRVIKGLDVVDTLTIGDEIKSAKVARKRDHEYTPETTPE